MGHEYLFKTVPGQSLWALGHQTGERNLIGMAG